jgi:hypothetical protein
LLGVGLGTAARVQQAHPLLQGLDLVALRGESPAVSGVPGWAQVVLGTSQGPLLLDGRLDGRPAVVVAFDPTTSGLDKSLAFPLLVSNATSHLLAQVDGARLTGSDERFDNAETDIRPRPAPSFAASAPQVQSTDGWLDRWPWLVAAVLVVLAAEWVVFARRG